MERDKMCHFNHITMPGKRSTCQSKMVIMYLLSKGEAVGHDDQGARKLKHDTAVQAITSTL